MVEQLRQGQTTVRDLVRVLVHSQEYRQKFFGGDGQQARERATGLLYQHLLGRAADPEGLRTYEKQLTTWESVGNVMDTLISSPEYQSKYGTDTVPGGRIRYCPGTSAWNSSTRQMRFANMDRNGNGSIERDEWDGTRASFNTHDWNRDGVLSGDEVRYGSRRSWEEGAAETDFDPDGGVPWNSQNFRAIDRNRDNRITRNEWYYSPESFRRADRNGDGMLSVAEFTDQSWGDDRDDRFENLDMNNNSRIERSEWHGSDDAFTWLDRNGDNVLSRAEVLGTQSGSSRFNTFTVLDTNRNGRIESNEWRWSQRSFTKADTNSDGILSRREFDAIPGVPEQ
jgi:Ca2+-binding EF-hand superfamily protein